MRHRSVLAFAFVASAISLSGQVGGTGSIEGTVIDPSGAAVGGASVVAKNISTGIETYQFSALISI